MKRTSEISRLAKLLLAAGLLAALFPTGTFLLSIVRAETNSVDDSTSSAVVSQDVMDKLKQTDPDRFTANVSRYKTLLTTLDVHPALQSEIDGMILQGHRLPTLLIAYEFLYHAFGNMDEWKQLVGEREAGKSWETLFREYSQGQAAFVPRAFEPDYLEGLMKNPGLSADDIMIADRISFETGQPVQELIEHKLESGSSWKEISAANRILFSASVLPRTRITSEQLSKHVVAGRFTEEQVTRAFVLAQKLGLPADEVVGNLKGGMTEEAVFAEALQAKYE